MKKRAIHLLPIVAISLLLAACFEETNHETFASSSAEVSSVDTESSADATEDNDNDYFERSAEKIGEKYLFTVKNTTDKTLYVDCRVEDDENPFHMRDFCFEPGETICYIGLSEDALFDVYSSDESKDSTLQSLSTSEYSYDDYGYTWFALELEGVEHGIAVFFNEGKCVYTAATKGQGESGVEKFRTFVPEKIKFTDITFYYEQ